ncbi:MAG: LPS assembly protein LptD, partial [Alphaproteobacteria bacterium]|nr:LPS assembly protein LptD [Alphaproteobacteria bacterium]
TAVPDRPYVRENPNAVVEPVLPEQPVAKAEPKKSPVDYAADAVDYDQDNKIVTLTGNVELKQDGRTLQSDKVVYNLKDDIATAEGNVIITDANGDVHHAESVELSDRMRQGLVDKIATTMTDGSRAWADEGIKESEQRYHLKNAAYTACEACKEDPSKRPPWQLHAKEVNVLKDEQRIEYKHAWLDLWGLPVLYTPYFSHPDGSVDQKSGLLTPSFGWNSELGGFYAQPYYWAISPSTDATFTVMPTTKEGPLGRVQFRKRFDDAYFETDTSFTHSSRTDSVNNTNVAEDAELRGHFFGKGGWDINDHWRARADIQLASDEQYLRQYGYSDDDILESRLYAERFEGRNYAIIEGMGFQDIRAGSAKSDQPNILPYAEMNFMGDPNATLGGRWEWNSSLLSLSRDGNGQDEWRGSTRASWARQDIMPVGLVFNTELGARADFYATTDRIEHALNPAEPDDEQDARFFPNAQFTASYPLKNNFKSFQLRVEPVTTVYLSPDIDNSTDIPNEDSQDVQLDVGNLLDGNRFPGLDRIEDKSHVAYGLKTGLYSYEGGYLDTFLGQSYNFDDDGNPFNAGSGLDTQSSDYVGSVNASFDGGKQYLSYRFQVDSDTLASQRHEMYGRTTMGPVQFDGSYMYAKGVAGTTYADSREQVTLGSTVELSDLWTLRADSVYDLSSVSENRGLRRALGTLTYTHQCYDIAVTADRNLANDSSGVQETTVMFRIGLKNLGEYATDKFQIGKNKTSDN